VRIGNVEVSLMVHPPEMLEVVCEEMANIYGAPAVYRAFSLIVMKARSKKRMLARMEYIVARPDRFAYRCRTQRNNDAS
jgi:hypothetical protein